MPELNIDSIKEDLIDRRERIQNLQINKSGIPDLNELLQQIDDAIERIENGSYGLCEVCHDPIEEDRLRADPTICLCLEHLTSKQRKELEDDLELAVSIQKNFLPKKKLTVSCWDIFYCYEPAGIVSGDYCDLMVSKNDHEHLHFILGDISGKGIAASMLMSHLHAMFHSLVEMNFPVEKLVAQANRLFCESTAFDHYATLVYAQADSDGNILICNAGHCPPLLISSGKVKSIDATGVPIGLFCESDYSAVKVKMEPDDYLILYTDGLTETRDGDTEYGTERLKNLLSEMKAYSPENAVEYMIRDVNSFSKKNHRDDDMTIMVIKRML
jgi:sigma-B regulation protein RsbU (phosphoserine phosphatase)